MTMTTTDRISRVWHTVADFQTRSTPWPDPESSIGAFCRKLGKNQCWELIGPGLERYQSLAKDVKEYLEQYCRKETATVLWSGYMVGRSTGLACPTVFFCSHQTDPRKRVRKIVNESGILEKYPGFKTSDSNRPPDMGPQLIKMAGGDNARHVGSSCTCGSPTGLSISTRLTQSEDATQHTQNLATIGAILHFGETLCFTTAAHAFGIGEVGFESQDDSDFEFDLDDDIETVTDSECQSECVISPVQQVSDSPSCREASQLQLENESRPATKSSSEGFFSGEDVVFSSSVTVNPFLDYALVPMEPKDPRLLGAEISQESTCDYHYALPKDVARSNQGGPVVAYTGSRRVVHGTLLKSPSFMTSMATGKTQELWTVKFEQEAIARGDCGSLVMDLAARKYIGHIVAGSPLSGSALVVPASDVFDDIRDRSGQNLSLATDMKRTGAYGSTQKAETLVRDKVPPEILMTASGNRGVLQAEAKSVNADELGDRLFAMGVHIKSRSDDQIVRKNDSVEVMHERESQDHEALGARHKLIFETVHNLGEPKEAEETYVRVLKELMENLDEAIEAARQEVQSTPLADRLKKLNNWLANLNKLSNWLARRHERTGEMMDLEEAIDTAQRAVQSTPPDLPYLAASLSNLGSLLGRRSERSREMKDLGEAIDTARRAVSSTPSE